MHTFKHVPVFRSHLSAYFAISSICSCAQQVRIEADTQAMLVVMSMLTIDLFTSKCTTKLKETIKLMFGLLFRGVRFEQELVI